MSSLASAPVTRGPSGLVGRCQTCGVVVEQVPAFDEDVALGTFLQAHPLAPEALHRDDLPAGWRTAQDG